MRSSFFRVGLVGLASLVWAQPPVDAVSDITAALRAKRFEQALKLAQPALEREPNNVRILTLKALALAGLDRDTEALAVYDLALGVQPDYLAALEGAAQLEYRAGQKRAISLLDRLLKLQPDNSTAHAMRGVMAWKEHDCETAIHHFALAGTVIANEADALEEYIGCLAGLERPAEAVPVLRQLAALRPEDRQVRYRLAAAQYMAKSYAEAAQTLGPLLSVKDVNPDALDLASLSWEALGDTPRAVAALRQAIVLAPTDIRLYIDFATLSLVHKSYETGIKMIDAGLARLPGAAQLYVARGVLNVQLAQYEQADADFAAAERLEPRQSFGSLARGFAEVEQNDLDKALTTVRTQLQTQRGNPFLYYLLAEILASKGADSGTPEFREATDAALRAVTLKPDFTLARDILSRLYFNSGEMDKAIEQCRLALRDNPLDATALYRLIRALQKSGLAGAEREVPALLKRFNEVRQQLNNQEAEEGRYRLVAGAGVADK